MGYRASLPPATQPVGPRNPKTSLRPSRGRHGARPTMHNPNDLDPRPRFHDDDEDEPEGAPREGSGAQGSYLEKSLLEARTLLISGPVTDRMLRDATVPCLAMEQKDAQKPSTVLINSPCR